jgi:predicted RNA-binding Zn-ribbon protein involved in translation (DUF1610 family)
MAERFDCPCCGTEMELLNDRTFTSMYECPKVGCENRKSIDYLVGYSHGRFLHAKDESTGAQQPQQSICRWTWDNEKWDTACGEAFTFIDGGPVENGMKFCPYCGKQLAVR